MNRSAPHTPPRWPLRFLRWVIRNDYLEEIEGDMEEVFQDNLEQHSLKKARRRYAWETVKLLRPAILKHVSIASDLIPTAMILHYFKVAWRNTLRSSLHSTINVLGLSLGLACFCLLFLYIQEEGTFDRFHANWDCMYRLIERVEDPEQGTRRFGSVAGPLGQALVEDFPEVEMATSLIAFGQTVNTVGDSPNQRSFNERSYFLAQPGFFQLFDFDVLEGNPHTCLEAPNAIVLTRRTAQKYFGDASPIGKRITNNRVGEVEVTAVVQDPPSNSHLQFDFLLSYNAVLQSERYRTVLASWDHFPHHTYLLLEEGHRIGQLRSQLPDFLQKYRGEQWEQRQVELQPLGDVHFESADVEFAPDQSPGNKAYVYIFAAVCAFILIIGCINYSNLATARSLHRGREIGLRKVVGAKRGQLMGQFLGEALLTALLAGVLGVVLAELSLGVFNELAGKDFAPYILSNASLAGSLGMLVVATGLLSGLFPALFLSKFKPVHILRGEMKTGGKAIRLRQGLVVAQFALSIFMLIATGVLYHQLHFMRTKELGFNQAQKIVIDINSGRIRNNFQAIKSEFLSHPEVQSVSATSRVPGEWKNLHETTLRPRDSRMDSMSTYFFCADQHMLEVFDMTLVVGRNFSGNMASDSSSLLLNETAVRSLGWDDAVGKRIDLPGARTPLEVIGVVKDFHFESLRKPIEPLAIGAWVNPVSSIDYLTCHVSGERVQETLEHLIAVHERFDAETPVEYHFLDQQIDRFYKEDARAGKVLGLAAILTVFIACLGLFGLASFIVEQRSKEISIRKVLGASVKDVLLMLSRQFVLQVLIAFLIAAPLAWWFMQDWLNNFAYKVGVNAGILLGAGLICLVIALLTVSYSSLKAAHANPADTLKT